jgi:hypothetical protein
MDPIAAGSAEMILLSGNGIGEVHGWEIAGEIRYFVSISLLAQLILLQPGHQLCALIVHADAAIG